jgi:predicted branched-subunit amino acid permease
LTRSNHLKEFTAGARDIIPMMIGAAPFGVIYGTLVASGPLQLWHGQLMSLVVFAGSAQFIALGLIAGHASFAVIWATTLVVNLRHICRRAGAGRSARFSPTRSSRSPGSTIATVSRAPLDRTTSSARVSRCI